MRIPVREHYRRKPKGGTTSVRHHQRDVHAGMKDRGTTIISKHYGRLHTEKSFYEFAQSNGLSNLQSEEYAMFMSSAFENDFVTDSYAKEWVGRFKMGRAWDASDNERRKVLKKVYPEKYADFKEGWTEYVEPFNPRVKDAVTTDRVGSYEQIRVRQKSGQKYLGYTSYVNGDFVGYFSPNKNDIVERKQLAIAQKRVSSSGNEYRWKPGED